jgi:hypothetical protein
MENSILTSANATEMPAGDSLVVLTARAYSVAIAAAQSAADLILGAKSALERTVACERELDELDRKLMSVWPRKSPTHRWSRSARNLRA